MDRSRNRQPVKELKPRPQLDRGPRGLAKPRRPRPGDRRHRPWHPLRGDRRTLYVGLGGGVLAGSEEDPPWVWERRKRRIDGDHKVLYLAVAPSEPQRLYAVLRGAGVYRSDDGGVTWTPGPPELADDRARTVVVDPLDPDTVYAATREGGVRRSRDGGVTWRPLNAGLPVHRVNALAIDPQDPARLYAGTERGVFDIDLED